MAKIWRVLLAEFNVDYYEQGDLIITSCPVHQGTYKSSFNLNINEDSDYFGSWFCNSNGCHNRFGKDMIGLTMGLLNTRDTHSFNDAIKFCEDLTKNVDINYEYKKIDNVTNFFGSSRKETKHFMSREQVRSKLLIPAKYYIDQRNFSASILDEFDVGYCNRPDSQMYRRVVFPVYNETGEWMVGCCGRRLSDGPNKWINSKGFSKSSHLYAYHRAIKRAKEVGALILVEGQGDTIRMHEAGILNTVGIFGASLSDSQEFLIQRSGVMNIILAMDSDEVGQLAFAKIRDRLKDLFNVYKLELPAKDIGDMSVDEVCNLKKQISKFI